MAGDFPEVGIEAVIKGLDKFIDGLGKMDSGMEDVDDSIKDLSSVVDTLGENLDTLLTDQMLEMEQQTKLLAKIVDNTMTPAMEEFDDETDDATESADKFGLGLKDVGEKAKNFGAGVSNLTQVVIVGLGTALGNLITGGLNLIKDAFVEAGRAAFDFTKESVNMAASFQDQVTILDIAAGDTVDTLGSMKDIALAVGGDIRLAGISAVGAADGMTELFKAGLDTTAIFGDLNAFMNEGAELGGALRASIDLAAASELELAEAASLSAVVLSTFGDAEASAAEQAEFVNFALNNMVKAADASVADVSDLAAALTNVGPTAAAAGLDLEEVNTALAILSTRGITGAEAGTALKSAIANMRRPTAAVQDELSKWGISLFDAEGNMFDFVDIIGQFEIALADATEEQRAQAIQTIAGTFGMNAMNALLGEGVQGWADMQEAMDGAATIQEQAAAKTATFTGIQEALEGTIETLKIQIGDALLPVLSNLNLWFTDMVSTIGPAVVNVFSVLGESLNGFANFIIAVLEDGDTLNDWLTHIPESIRPFVQGLGEIIVSLKEELPKAIARVTTFWETILLPAITAVWTFITSSLIPTILDIKTKFDEFIVAIQPIIDALVAFFVENGPSALESFKTIWDEVWGFILAQADKVIAWFVENGPLIMETGQAIVDFWQNSIVPALDNIWEIIKTAFSAVLDAILMSAEIFMQVLTGDWEGAWENIKLLFAQIGLAMLTIWDEFLEGVLNAFGTNTEAFIAMWSTNWENAKLIFGTFMLNTIDALQTWSSDMQGDVSNFFITLIVSWIDNWESVKLIFKTVLVNMLTGLQTWITDFQTDISNFFTTGIAAWQANWDAIALIVETVWTNIKTSIETKITAIKTSITNFVTAVQTAVAPVTEAVKGLIDKVAQFADKLAALKDKLPDWMKPGSPPPLFFAIQDINRAMGELTSSQLPKMKLELENIAPLGAGLVAAPAQAMAGPTMAAGSVMQNTVNINQNNSINSGISQSAFDARIMNAVNRAIATSTR